MINKLLREDFEIRIGRHRERAGYWAIVFENGVGDAIFGGDWDNAGHGFTVEEALENAELIAKDQPPKLRYKLEDFDNHDEWDFDFDYDDDGYIDDDYGYDGWDYDDGSNYDN